MKCEICGMQYPPKGWTYYRIMAFEKTVTICSDCIDHAREVKEDENGVVLGYERGLNLTGSYPSQEIVMKNGKMVFVGEAR